MIGRLFGLLFMLAMAGISKLLPNKKVENSAIPNDHDVRKFTLWNNISGWIMLVIIVLCFYVLAGMMPGYRKQALPHDQSLLYAVLPDGFFWFLVGMVFMIGFSAVIYTVLTRLYMWSNFDGFVKYSNQKSGFNAYKGVYFVCGPFLIGGLVLLFFLWDYGVYIYKDRVVIHGFPTAKEKTYTYQQVKSIYYTPEGHNYGAHYQVKFDDGEVWNNLTDLRDDRGDQEVGYIAKQSGIPVDTLFHDPQ
jgi:hypothetical protein